VKIVDLSRELYHKTPTYPGHPPIIHGVWTTHEESFVASGHVHGLSSMYISMPDHAGTHIDLHRPADEVARRYGIADPRGGGVRDVRRVRRQKRAIASSEFNEWRRPLSSQLHNHHGRKAG
jgi:hypothetical protein